MSYVVLDTDVTSYAFKHHELPAPIVEAILHNRLCITFVTLAELTNGRSAASGAPPTGNALMPGWPTS